MIKVGRVGTWTGRAWYLPMALLFFPISRASPILRLLNMPFEHAVRYHRWLGHLSLWVLLTHSITFSLHIYYTGGQVADGVSDAGQQCLLLIGAIKFRYCGYLEICRTTNIQSFIGLVD